jgi:hypothetical protein
MEPGRVAQPDRVGGGEQAEGRVRPHHATLVEQREPAGRFSTRWITNMTSGRPASYSSKQSATLCW